MAHGTTIRKSVIPAAGMGTRLLPITKEIPKEMLPIAVKRGGILLLKPMLQAVFEQLYDGGIREFCFITGRGKRSIEDHFTPDWSYVNKVSDTFRRSDLKELFERIERSDTFFVNQSQRRGFGDAVFRAKGFVGSEPFIVHAGDDLVVSPNMDHIDRLCTAFTELRADAMLMVEHAEDPTKFGVIVGDSLSGHRDVISVKEIIEKPKDPPSNLAVIAVYAFSPKIFDSIATISVDSGGEIQLTSAIQHLIQNRGKVFALDLGKESKRLEIGTPESYINSITGIIGR